MKKKEVKNMSKNFNKVKKHYDVGFWNKAMVYNVVGKLITADEYTEITGEPYSE